jgi:hypothetical protein
MCALLARQSVDAVTAWRIHVSYDVPRLAPVLTLITAGGLLYGAGSKLSDTWALRIWRRCTISMLLSAKEF